MKHTGFVLPILFVACAAPVDQKRAPTQEGAKAFIKQVNEDLKKHLIDYERASWIKATYITHDTEILAAEARERSMAFSAKAIKEATRFDGLDLDEETRRQLYLLKTSESLPAPSDPVKRKRLAQLSSKLSSLYGKGKHCSAPDQCKDLGALSKIMGTSQDEKELLEAWRGWRTISQPMRPLYAEYVSLANLGAQEIGYKNLGDLWKAGYDMPPDDFARATEQIWDQIKPLYEALHCHLRAKLSEKYGADKVDPEGLIPAHLLGNMWAQEWMNLYPLVEPYPGASDINVTAALNKKKVSPVQLVKMGEAFFVSLGLDPLPETFWQRSMFEKPLDREVMCHASAWDVDYANDLRIKMCIKIDEEDLITVHHELGHNYYYHYYHMLPALYQRGANGGFHEGIGDTLALSVTPEYLKQIGILEEAKKNEQAVINLQMKRALDKIAFIPFGKLVDQWRWNVFAGKVKPEQYNAGWWELRKKYQGVAPPIPRSEADFDPGAKYHVAASVSYTRYFLALALQFQFHEALCKAAGHAGPLHTCSIYGSKEAGLKLRKMLSMGASRPWPEALEVVAGKKEMDATPMVKYFTPLMGWLAEKNKGRKCGW